MYFEISNPMDYHVGLYIRLSKEDENEGPSESVNNQRSMLEEFVKQAHGPCGSAPVSGVPEFSPGAGSSAAAVLLWLSRCGDRRDRFSVGSMASRSFTALVTSDIFVGSWYTTHNQYG